MAMSTSTFSDEIDGLLIELSASLEGTQRAAFEVAARAALAAADCSGIGAAYRLIGPLQRAYWDPPPDDMRREGARHPVNRMGMVGHRRGGSGQGEDR